MPTICTVRTNLKGEGLLDYYRGALMTLYGYQVAVRSRLKHARGWYQITPAQQLDDGTVFISETNLIKCRATRVREMADELLKRAKEQSQ